jgi:hypothetical protein
MADVLSFLSGLPFGAAITGGASWIIRKRQEAMEILNIISNNAPYYNQLARNAWNFSWDLTHGERDYKLLMYYICNLLRVRNQISLKLGDLQLDNLEAERIISKIGSDIYSVIKKEFTHVEFSELTHLSKDNKPYHEFHQNISNDTHLYDKFERWLKDKISKEDFEELEKKCAWYAQLIMLELNHIYRLWYSEEPPLILRDDLKKYLQKEEQKYYNRIVAFETQTKLKKN